MDWSLWEQLLFAEIFFLGLNIINVKKKSLTLSTSNRMFSFLLARIKIFSLYLHYFMFEPGFFFKAFLYKQLKGKSAVF